MENPTFHLEGIVRTRDEMQDFSGPLSLILMLLSKNKIEIRDLRISEILDQYLDYISSMQEMDLDIASEFVQMASHLVYIKTRTLLVGDDVEELDELMTSLEQLRCHDAYLSIKAVTPELFSASLHGSLVFSKQPEPQQKLADKSYTYNHDPQELLLALSSVLSRGNRTQSSERDFVMPRRIIFGVREKCSQLVSLLRTCRRKSLRELYLMSHSRSEVVATFISILELCAGGSIAIEETDGELTVSLVRDGEIELSDTITD
jgi:segregation and condensation protein A